MKKQIKFTPDLSKLDICDFKNHALEDNLLRTIEGGFPKITFKETVHTKSLPIN